MLKVFQPVPAILGSRALREPFFDHFGPSGHHNWPFLCQKGVIVISPDDDHPVPTFVQLVLAILGSRALQMPFLAILEHFDPKRVKKCPKMAKLVQICVIKVDFTHMALFLWENVEKVQKKSKHFKRRPCFSSFKSVHRPNFVSISKSGRSFFLTKPDSFKFG